ncbi:hypothetical protein [Massilia sp. IC2-476]|uniref:hypothetical protein n=1 Tax=Massilia sp. IC2-476 TaxID=2887199 RepID=UPI001D107934|nr:hypothetical protein [Massilia sp. IC2-476]MCC2971052.1 hypothetical protein [Massilia sp. IC2-476]
MRLREIAIGIVLSALLAAVVALTVPAPQPPAVALPAPSPVSLRSATPALLPKVLAAIPSAAPQRVDTAWFATHARFGRARSLREFFYDAVRKPGKGALYYAAQALSICERVLEQDPAALPPARRQAAAELQRRCDFSPEGLQDARRELRAAKDPDPGADAVLDTVFGFLSADGAEGRAGMLGRAFEQGNPEMIAPLAAAAVVAHMSTAAPGAAFGEAMVVCRLGAECGPDAVATLELCMRHGWCADSVPAALQQGLGQHFPALDKVAAQVVRDLRRPSA